jgi:hypothetical protein
MNANLTIRPAPTDAEAIASICNEGSAGAAPRSGNGGRMAADPTRG